ncbi:hypothetical protein FRB99_000947 [Tulasnella sp. 403]|nr:hypothetical protein FRB99_000947 [Tulasnella sp. 403]
MSQIQTPDSEDTSSDIVKAAYKKVAAYMESAPVRLNSKEPSYPKLLNAMLEFAPCEDGRNYVAQSIIDCSSDKDLHDLAQYWVMNLLTPIKAQGGRTPAPSSHNSDAAHSLSVTLTPAKRDRGLMKLNALKRDGYRCTISKSQDWNHFDEELGGPAMELEAAHILPFSLNNLKSDQMASITLRSQKPVVWQIIEMFSRVRLEDLNGQDINRLENILTLSSIVHHRFGELNIWLKSVEGQPNCYRLELGPKVRYFASNVIPPAGTMVEFTTPDTATLPLPDPRYLALHAACAQVAHASGAAKYIDELLRDVEDRTVLAEDGSSVQLLDHVLSLVNACA